MRMLKRLRYLLAEGFEVGNVCGIDAPAGSGGPGRGSITYVVTAETGSRRLRTEEFQLGAGEARRCARLYLRSMRR
ncbi:hypothetical protein [Haloferula sargassicola]|uniref:CinA C-terminal domain-containing protein n=1 Tax=Haloferula sargassicola TaxID=490096 RepID=A0ABP9UNA0_9BACT